MDLTDTQQKWAWGIGIVFVAYVVLAVVGVVPTEYNMIDYALGIEDDSSGNLTTTYSKTTVYGIPSELNLTDYSYNHIALHFYQEKGQTDDLEVTIDTSGLSGVRVELVGMTNDWSVNSDGDKAIFKGNLQDGDRISGLALEVEGNNTGNIDIDVDGGDGLVKLSNDHILVTTYP